MADWMLYLALLTTGFIAGTLNVIAGGGSFLTLPVLIFMGLPPSMANGTNRVGILFQNAGAVWGFNRHRVLDWRRALGAALPASIGAVFGTWAALVVGEQTLQKILSILMLAVTLWTFLSRAPSAESVTSELSPTRKPGLLFGFFVVGFYGGFVQAGVGFLVLAVTSMAGLDLVRGNAIKVLCILSFTVLSLSIFSWQGKVDWTLGLILALGMLLGGQLGVHLTTLKGHRWVKRVTTVTVIAFAVKLWFS